MKYLHQFDARRVNEIVREAQVLPDDSEMIVRKTNTKTVYLAPPPYNPKKD